MRLSLLTRFLVWLLNTRPDVEAVNLQDSSLAPDEIDPDQDHDHEHFDQPLDDHRHSIEHLYRCLSLDPSRYHHP
jgi:hypothetical protein